MQEQFFGQSVSDKILNDKCSQVFMARRQTQEQFIAAAAVKHNNKYDYSKVFYVNNNTSVIIICPIHGEFNQLPRSHSVGKGCYECGRQSRYLTNEDFIILAGKIHGNEFDYSKINYTHSFNKVIIICLKHGEFEQIANNHLNGAGCPACASIKNKFTEEEFINLCATIHNNKYDYSKTLYKSLNNYITIVCKIHGEFVQRANHHLYGHGCDKCRSSISKVETKWLDSLFIPDEYRQKIFKINYKKYKVDAFDPTTNTIYEFYGDYWHGNPKKFNSNDLNVKLNKTYGELYVETIERENLFKSLGYNIISIWQSDYND